MEVSSLSRIAQSQQCYIFISSWYSTVFNITSVSEWRWISNCFSQGSPPRQCYSSAFSISFHNRQELFPSPPGCLSLLSIISGCHQQDCYRAASILQSVLLCREGDGLGTAAASSRSSVSALLGTTSSDPKLLSHQRHQAAHNHSTKEESGKKAKSQRPY